MKLCAIYNVWSDWYLLTHSVENISPHVDGIIIVGSIMSNYGEISSIPDIWQGNFIHLEPQTNISARQNETYKRNYGLNIAYKAGYTHFITMDADEFYDPIQFRKAKEYFHMKPNLNGLVVDCQCYFGSPELTIGKDITLVPFIHKLTPTIRHEFNRKYPFAWINGQIRIDPTRSLNIDSGVEMFDCTLHHYSWIRSDYEKKIRNSTARANLEKSTIRKDLLHAKEGYFCEFYQKHLVRVPNRFGIPNYGGLDKDLQQGGGVIPPGNKAE